jgi:hypothetical protein
MNEAGLPPAILKYAGGMFHLFILEGPWSVRRSFETGLRQAQSLLRMSG